MSSVGERAQINQLKRIKLAWIRNNSMESFDAVLTSELTLGSNMLFNDINTPSASLLTTVAANVAFGTAPAFRMPRAMAFAGSTPSTLHLDTILKVEKSVDEDIIKPITRLVQYAMPDTSDKSLMGEIDSARKVSPEKQADDSTAGYFAKMLLGMTANVLNDIVNVADNTLGKSVIRQRLNETFFLKVPPQLENGGSCYLFAGLLTQGDRTKASIKMGPFIIKGISLTLGKLLMTGRMPETVKVGIDLESYNTAAVSSDFIKILRPAGVDVSVKPVETQNYVDQE